MATPAPSPKILILFLLSLLILCSTGVFIKNQEPAPMEEEEEHQTFLFSRRQLIPTPILRFLDPTAAATPQVTVSPTPPLVTVPSSTPVPAAPSPPTTLPPPTLPPPTLPPPTPVTSNPPASNGNGNPAVTPPSAATPVTSNPPSSNAGTPPAASGQSWCVAKAGAAAASVQAALDYACGAGADCGAIQQGGACFNPNTLQNHASYAFSSYYQKRSGQTGSCNFNGVAETTNVNPSSGSCGYPTLSSSTTPTTAPPTPATPTPMTPNPTAPMTPTPVTPTPMTPNPATPTTMTPPSSGGFAAPPNIFNGINPPLGSGSTGFGLNPPTTSSTSSSSVSVSLQHTFISFIVLVASIITVLGI